MKQACEASRGANRRGREKRRGRNIGERGKLAGKWTLDAVAAMGKETPRKVLEAREGIGRVWIGQYSVEEEKRTRG
jgi:hypothetical protein